METTMNWTYFTKAAQLTPQPAKPQAANLQPTKPQAANLQPAKPSKPSQPATAQKPYDFNGELMGLMKPLAREYRANPGKYKADGVDLVQRLARDMRTTYADMRKNPSRYSDAQKRSLIANYRRQVEAIRGSASQRYVSAYNGKEAPSPYDPNAGWRQVGNGIYIIPRKSPSGPIDYFSGDYGGQLDRHRLAGADWRQVARWNNRMVTAQR